MKRCNDENTFVAVKLLGSVVCNKYKVSASGCRIFLLSFTSFICTYVCMYVCGVTVNKGQGMENQHDAVSVDIFNLWL